MGMQLLAELLLALLWIWALSSLGVETTRSADAPRTPRTTPRCDSQPSPSCGMFPAR